MTRFAGSRKGLDLSPGIDLSYSGATTGQVAGGGQKVHDAYAAVRATSPSFGDFNKDALVTRANEKSVATQLDASVMMNRENNEAELEMLDKRIDHEQSMQSAQNSSDMMSTALGGVFSLGGALLSDVSTKNTIENIDNALETLRQLRPVTFYYNEEYSSSPERQHHGFIAQEYKEVLPAATYYDESIGKLAIDTGELIALLVRSVQQLEGRVSHMEALQALAGVK